MNISTSKQMNALLEDLRDANTFSVDTETNGLDAWKGHRPISMSFWFPETEHSYNFAWMHGVGVIDIPEANKDVSKFHSWQWTGKGKKQVFKAYWFDQYRREHLADFNNVPADWLEGLREMWNWKMRQGAVTVVYFNAPFDIHMMQSIGFDQPPHTYDVRIAVALAFEDWGHPGLIDSKGEAINGENGLKWQAWKWGIPGALDGEKELEHQSDLLTERIAQYVHERPQDPMNASAITLKKAPFFHLKDLIPKVKFDKKSEMWCMPADTVAEYAENDTRITWLLHLKLQDHIQHFGQLDLYRDLSDMQAEFLIRCESNGILLDRDRALELIEEMEPIKDSVNEWFADQLREQLAALVFDGQDELAAQIEHDIAPARKRKGTGFTVGSTPKLRRALTVLTGFEWVKTDKPYIERFEERHGETEVVEQVKHYRHAQRAVGTYLKNWLKSQDEHGFIHGGFNANGTKTGRISSSSGTLGAVGNFQNIPSRGFVIKECLIAPEGFGLFQIDYSALELRLASWVAGCQPLIDAFNTGFDPHAGTRDRMNVGQYLHPGMDFEQAWRKAHRDGKMKSSLEALEASPQLAAEELATYYRQVAKTLNFGLLYGGGWRMVSRQLKLDEATSTELHDAWNKLYPEFRKANKDAMDQALSARPYPDGHLKKSGKHFREQYVTQPISGRTRKFSLYAIEQKVWDEVDERFWIARTMQKQAKDAFNFKVQGLGGYIMAMSGLYLCREFGNDIFKPFAEIHDSVDFYLRNDSYHILPRVVEILCDWDVDPQLAVEVEYAKDGMWQHVKAIHNLDQFIQEHAA